MSELVIDTPEWAVPLLEPARYKGIKGGRGSGKSHERAEAVVDEMIADPDKKVVCIREIQKSLKFSAKMLIESKIRQFGVSHMFEITQTEIRRKEGEGICIFQGMQDHTAESIKSLEGFDIAWVEEAQSLSKRSLTLLRPTIRAEGSEIWFTWNPEQPTDPVDEFFAKEPDNSILLHVNYDQNPFLSDTLREEMVWDRQKQDPSDFAHIWLGDYNIKSDALVFAGKHRIEEFEPGSDWGGPYHGMDFGFANDPTVAVRCWIQDKRLYIERDAGSVKLELDNTSDFIRRRIPGMAHYVIRADSARPESISYLKRKGLPKITAVNKWPGSVEDGIAHMKAYREIIIHPQCEGTAKEFRLYSYKVDKRTGDVMPVVEDRNNHYIDAIRYALEPMIRHKEFITAGMVNF